MAVAIQGKRALLTGATGLVGGAVARRLLGAGAHVRAMARAAANAEPLAAAGAEVTLADMTDHAALRQAVEGCAIIIHCAAVLGGEFQPWSTFRQVNVEGTRALALAALEAGVERFVHVSTAWVYGFDAGPDADETSPYRPCGDPYVDTKIEGERVIRELVATRGLPAIIVQPAEVYGPGDANWTLQTVHAIRLGRLILLNGGRGMIQPIYVDDLAEGVMAALQRGRVGETYILAGARAITIGEFFGHFGRMLGRERFLSIPRGLGMAVTTLAEWVARWRGKPPPYNRTQVRGTSKRATYPEGERSKAYRELGFLPRTSFEVGMREVEKWLAHEGLEVSARLTPRRPAGRG